MARRVIITTPVNQAQLAMTALHLCGTKAWLACIRQTLFYALCFTGIPEEANIDKLQVVSERSFFVFSMYLFVGYNLVAFSC